jgi:hypothetical protein
MPARCRVQDGHTPQQGAGDTRQLQAVGVVTGVAAIADKHLGFIASGATDKASSVS